MSDARVLVVDDDRSVTTVLRGNLEEEGYEVETARTAEEGLGVLDERHVDAVVTDLRMPGMGGGAFVGEVRRRWADLPVIVLTAHASVESAVEMMRAGAYDYLQKPFDRDDLLYCVAKAIRASRAGGERIAVTGSGLVLRSAAMADVDSLARRVAPTDATVLVTGETGVGKEVVARAIHDLSPRSQKPFLKVHCAALPESLLESELFGYERGAFTGAASRKPGRFELGDGGTLLLDEIGDITPATQVKLLRVLQDRSYERLGGTQTLIANVRVIAATHRDLDAMRRDGRFREDLYYRLNVFPIRIPPLRERREDIPDLARALLARVVHANRSLELGDDAIAVLAEHSWPGNVRELGNVVERMAILASGGRLGRADVQAVLPGGSLEPAAPLAPTPMRDSAAPQAPVAPVGADLASAREASERVAILRAIDRAGGNRTLAAKLLGISRRTLYTKLSELGIG